MSLLYALLLLLALACLVSILWSTIRYGIGPMPSSPAARTAMLELVPDPAPPVILELGSGWGGLALRLAERHPDSQVRGYERSLLPLLCSKLLGSRANLSFHFEDFHRVSIPQGSLLVCYLAPGVMNELAKHPGLRGCWLITHTFALPGHQPVAQRAVDDMYRSPMLLYRIE